ncbi:MAG TPA: YCF48-related protein [Candidatus Dormibacteraeota bacterium]
MIRSTRIGLFAELAVVLLMLASCNAFSTTAKVTPSPSVPGKGPIVANGGGPQVNLSTCAPGSQSEPFTAYALKMTSRTTGWALGQCALSARPSFPNGSTIQCYWPQSELMGILRTSDGGATWTDVSPPSVPNRTWYHTQFFLDANHAWVGEVSRTADACASQVTMFMTSDAGATWQPGGTVAIKTTAPTDDVFNVYGPTDGMDFADTQHGWLMVSSPPSAPQPGAMVDAVTLYATVDGGLHWSQVSSSPGKAACQSSNYAPASDVAFKSATAGWLAISCPAFTVLTTRDAGATWTAKALPNCSCQVYQPVYFDANRAVITGQQGSRVMLETADAGASWTQLQVPVAASSQFSFVDPTRGWMVGIEQLPKSYDTVVYSTIDSGQSWQLLGKPSFATATSSPNLYYPIQGVQFVDANTGFVVLGPEAGGQVTADPTAPQLQILSTVDGGHTWNTVLKRVPTAPPCSNFTQLGYGNGNAVLPAKMASATTGWARGGLRTTDGGAHWRDMSPAALRGGSVTPLYPPGYAESYLDGDHAWQAAVYGAKTSCADHVSTFATADGGKTWQPSGPITLNLPAGYQTGVVQIGFTSAHDGWLWVPSGAQTNGSFDMGPSTSQADLYTTGDGGLTWRHAASLSNSQLQGMPVPSGSQNCKPSLQRIEFSSPSVAWLSVSCAESPMLVSRDGGATWKVPSIAIPSSTGCPCYYDLPTFADSTHGMLVASGQNGLTGSTVLLTTSDGGTTWRESKRPGTGYVLLLDFLNANDVFALVTPPGWNKGSKAGFELYRSSDGGGNWTLVSPNVPATWPPGFLQFVDLNHGFEANVNGADVLLTTADGGKSWSSITPAM